MAFARWLINPADAVWLVYRRVQLVWMVCLTVWASSVRLALRRGLLLPDAPRLLLLAQQNEFHTVLTAWRRVPSPPPTPQLMRCSCNGAWINRNSRCW